MHEGTRVWEGWERGAAATWNSMVFGLAMTTACLPSSSRRMYLKASSCEQSAKVSASV